MEITIKGLKSEDLEEAAKVFWNSFTSVGEKWNLETAQKRLEQDFNSGSCWAAKVDSKIVGILVGKIDNVLDHQELYIDVIAVEPRFHNAGVGSKLLSVAEDYAKTQGYKAVWLLASTDLLSFNWYTKTGFKETSWKALVKEF